MKPVRLPASATLALPRWGLFALCLLYILPGLIRREPWKTDDAAGFGIMWTMAHGGLNDWLWPHIAGLPMPDEGPLAFWIGAICIKLFGWLLGDALAARISTIIFFLIGAMSVWYGAYRLGRRPEVQPLSLAFGGQPEPRDYGRMLADGALLIYLACLGLLLRSHETSAEALQISLVAFAFHIAVRLYETRAWHHALTLGVTLGLLVLARGMLVPIALWLGLLCITLRQPAIFARLVLISLPCALLIGASWSLATHLLQPYGSTPNPAWIAWHQHRLGWLSLDALRHFLRYSIWYAWPAWPFAGWAVYAWRKQEGTLHVKLSLAFILSLVVLLMLNPHPEETGLLPLLPPLAILAAFGLPTMKRGAINAVDWFSVMMLSGCAAFIWIVWIAKQTGWPDQIARNALKLAPGFTPEFNLPALVIAIAATLGWILLVHWRVARQPAVLWRAVVLSSGGVILCWLLLMTLWLPWLDYGKSYSRVAYQLSEYLPASDYCVDTNVASAQRASFAYFGKVRFPGFGEHGCNYLLLQDKVDQDSRSLLNAWPGHWKLLWEGRRPSDREERFRLYQQQP